MVSGCVNDWLGIDDISEIAMTDEQRKEYFKQICNKLPEIDIYYFNQFLQWVLETYGEFEMSEHPCPECGDYTVTYTLEI